MYRKQENLKQNHVSWRDPLVGTQAVDVTGAAQR